MRTIEECTAFLNAHAGNITPEDLHWFVNLKSQQMWVVLLRRPLESGERKVWVKRSIAMAPTAAEAIALVRTETAAPDEGTWVARNILTHVDGSPDPEGTTCYGVDHYQTEPTHEERQARTDKAKAARR